MILTVDRRHCGPPESGNGGWTAGSLAAFVATTTDLPAVRVRLHSPPPLDRPLVVSQQDDTTVLLDGEHVVASAWAALRPTSAGLGAVPFDVATAAAERYEGLHDHPFATCFSCGPDRDPADALCLRPGPLEDGSGRYAAAWTPRASEALDVWAALDCPGGWSAGIAGRPMVLGEMTAVIDRLPSAGSDLVVMATATGGSGRKHTSATALVDAAGDTLAIAAATWIAVDPQAVRPRP
ncbi:MAG: hypothetical protein KBB39_07905 [Phycicoccus sp.]|nr:hypothetical protein [Phycicoccus sp.]